MGIAIKKPDKDTVPAARTFATSRIARLIFVSNLAGLVILIAGSLVLNEMRAGLVQARIESLNTQGDLISSVMADVATQGRPEPALMENRARTFLKRLQLPITLRARLYDSNGGLVADSWLLADQVEISALPPLRDPNFLERLAARISDGLSAIADRIRPEPVSEARRVATLEEEIRTALMGEPAAGQRFSERGQRVVSVSVPIQRVSAVVGVLTIESTDVAEVVRAERAALLPFIGVAMIVALLSSTLLTLGIARPLRRLALAADRIRSGATDELEISRLNQRQDEIGELASSMEAMTEALFERIVANEKFAADVAHELKNPLTSIRSAVETLERVENPASQQKLHKVIASDVKRLDRLITDISNASRLEAEIARSRRERVDLRQLLSELADTYDAIRNEGDPHVMLVEEDFTDTDYSVWGRDGPLGQVFRNLVENARSFSPPDGEVRLILSSRLEDGKKLIEVKVEDQGPGIPPDKLEKIFDRFYTDRPAGAKFGLNSGLGLSIVSQIIDTHKGSVRAENKIDQDGEQVGARFIVNLPGAV